jgi:hypothetical protein|tara:strand:+ start:237 stop:458 length:222 start_codon:yes stop_codon:yes gene_type:complete
MKRRTSSTIPFGYKLVENNFLEEIPEQQQALKKIIPFIKEKSISLREGATWLEYETGRYVSHVGLKKIADKHE